MRGKKITAIICSLGMLLSSVSVSGESAVTSTEKGTFFNVKTDESGRYHFEYRFDENGKKKGNDITHAAYIISTKEDVSSLKTDDTLLYSLEEIKNIIQSGIMMTVIFRIKIMMILVFHLGRTLLNILLMKFLKNTTAIIQIILIIFMCIEAILISQHQSEKKKLKIYQKNILLII